MDVDVGYRRSGQGCIYESSELEHHAAEHAISQCSPFVQYWYLMHEDSGDAAWLCEWLVDGCRLVGEVVFALTYITFFIV